MFCHHIHSQDGGRIGSLMTRQFAYTVRHVLHFNLPQPHPLSHTLAPKPHVHMVWTRLLTRTLFLLGQQKCVLCCVRPRTDRPHLTRSPHTHDEPRVPTCVYGTGWFSRALKHARTRRYQPYTLHSHTPIHVRTVRWMGT